MRSMLLLLCGLFGVTACHNETYQAQAQIQDLEQALTRHFEAATANELLQAYVHYVQTHPNDSARNAAYLYRGATIYYKNRNLERVTFLTKQALHYYPHTPTHPQTLLLAAHTHEQLGQLKAAKEYYSEFIRLYPQEEGISEAQFFLKPESEKLQIRITAMEEALQKSTTHSQDQHLLLLKAYQNYVERFPEAPMAAEYCFSAAGDALALGKTDDALLLYQKLYTNYPTSPRIPSALMQLGTLCESKAEAYAQTSAQKKRYQTQARTYYKIFLEKYPEHELYAQVERLYKQVGMNPNDVILQFQKAQ